MHSPVENGTISVAFVRPSVRPSVCMSVRRIREPKGLGLCVPKFGRKVLHRRCNSYISFKVKRSNVRVTRPINADTHTHTHTHTSFAISSDRQGLRTSNMILIEDDDPHQPQALWPPRSKVKVTRLCRPNPAATLLVNLSTR